MRLKDQPFSLPHENMRFLHTLRRMLVGTSMQRVQDTPKRIMFMSRSCECAPLYFVPYMSH